MIRWRDGSEFMLAMVLVYVILLFIVGVALFVLAYTGRI